MQDWPECELVPFLRVRNQRNTIKLLHDIKRLDLSINWRQIIDFQFKCLKKGLNGIVAPDLIIAQNAKQNHCEIYTLDRYLEFKKDVPKLLLMS